MIEWHKALYALLACVAWLALYWACFRRYRRAQPDEGSGQSAVVVAYASQSGRALGIARRLAASLPGAARLLPLNRLDRPALLATRQLYCIASTYGEGEAPDNGARFLSQLEEMPPLPSLCYRVLALGDREYPQFCAYGQQLDTALNAAGARREAACCEIDSASPQMDAQVDDWLRTAAGDPDIALAAAAELPGYGAFLPWRLVARDVQNAGSPGDPLYAVRLSPPEPLSWQAGEIAEIRLPGVAMRPREYSIASLPDSGELELLVRLQTNAEGQPGLVSGPLCTQLALGEYVEVKLRRNPLFATPADSAPLILIGAGSGLAGLWGHLLARRQRQCRQNWLLFGERSPRHDRPFAGRIAELEREGYLPALDLCFSRADSGAAYVQEVLRCRALALQDWLARGAVIMVCGSRDGMGAGVHRALLEVLGAAQLERLQDEGRYRRDVY